MTIRQFLLFLLISICIQQGSTQQKVTRQKIEEVATKCCTGTKRDCCIDMIRYGKPIGCGYQNNKQWAELLYTCIQDTMFEKQVEKKMNLDDSVCCQVFSNDQNDLSRSCESSCKNTMMAPSLDAATRLHKVEHCTIVDNLLYSCFTKCRQLRTNGIRIEVLHFQEYCNATYLANKHPVILNEYENSANYQKR